MGQKNISLLNVIRANITSSGQIKDPKHVSSTERERIRRNYNKKQ